MRIIRYQYQGEPARFGWILEDMVGPLEGSPFGEFRRLEATIPLSSVKLLAPVQPSKILCIGHNYPAHVKERGSVIPDVPLLFLKPPSAVIGPGEKIILPPQSTHVEHEAELVVVLHKRGRWIPPESAMDHVFGYTIGNDISARDLQRQDGQWTRAKGFDTFAPIGPWIETDFNPSDAMISCVINGEMRQMASTRDMIFNVRQLLAYVSSIMTLEPGDILFTGTPSGVSPLQAGDSIEITIEGIGTLANRVSN